MSEAQPPDASEARPRQGRGDARATAERRRGPLRRAVRDPRLRGIALAAAGAAALGWAVARPATALGELAGVLAALASCLGWGSALSPWMLTAPGAHAATAPSPRPAAGPAAAEPAAARTVLGLCFVLIAGTVAARFGLATRNGLLALVALGLGAAALRPFFSPPARASLTSPASPDSPAYSWAQRLFIALGIAFLLCAELFDLSPLLGDGKTHGFSVARLWQLSELPVVRGLLGGQTIGEALFALGGDARSAGMFDAGVAAALVVWLLASACARPRLAQGFVLLAVLALPVVFHSDPPSAPTARWTASLLLLAGGLRLRRALALGARDRGVFLVALALVLVRSELALAATALVLAGLLLPRELSAHRTKRATALLLSLAWLVPLGAALFFFRARPFAMPALLVAGALGFALAHVVVLVGGLTRWRDELSFAIAAAAGTALLASTRFAGVLQQATFPVWFALVALVLTRVFVTEAAPDPRADEADDADAEASAAERDVGDVADQRTAARLRGPIGVLLAFAVASTVFLPLLQAHRHRRVIARGMRVVQVASDLHALGFARAAATGSAELQARVPAGAALGFWGESPVGLDFRRNPIVDLSWPANARSSGAFLTPLSRHRIARIAYLLVSGPPEYLPPASWSGGESTVSDLEGRVELVAESRSARLFRVRPGAAQLK